MSSRIHRQPSLLREPDFRRAYVAGAVSMLGDSLQFVAVLWYAVTLGGPLGVIAVRVVDTLPGLLFGLHGGAAADRRNRRGTLVAANLAAGCALVPVAVAGVTGALPLWGLALGGFAVATASSYFTPAFGSLLPSLAGRARVQQANALVNATNAALRIGGLGLAAGLLAAVPAGVFFALNAVSFFVSAALLSRLPRGERLTPAVSRPRPTAGFGALRHRPGLGAAVAMLGAGMSVQTGVWTVGIASLANTELGGASSLSLLLLATGVGTIGAGVLLSHRTVRRKVLASSLVWTLVLPGYLLLGTARSLPLALLGTAIVGATSAAAAVLVTAAAQESIPDDLLGRALGVVFVANVGSKPLGLLVLAPLYLVLDPTVVFAAGGVVLFLLALAAAAAVVGASRRARALPATDSIISLR